MYLESKITPRRLLRPVPPGESPSDRRRSVASTDRRDFAHAASASSVSRRSFVRVFAGGSAALAAGFAGLPELLGAYPSRRPEALPGGGPRWNPLRRATEVSPTGLTLVAA